VSIFCGVKGYLDNIELSKIKNFESQLLSQIKSDSPEILSNISSTGKLDEANETKLRTFIEKFKSKFEN
jgi:F-type H+-transporting ATPase subunit alpha